jgi:cation diffusion facilitator CzcD-associated flavoprotein CzcO
MLDWLIVGGGIHGTYLSLYLMRRRNVARDRIRVLDPHTEPLALWHHFTRNSGMEFLRSAHAHNLHYDSFSLITFTRTQAGEPLARFIEPYGRPSLELFRAHCAYLVNLYNLRDLRITGRARRLTRLADGWRVETEDGTLDARRVVIAIGNTEQPYWPEWTRAARTAGLPIHHLFDPVFDRADIECQSRTAVVGGGITAVQTALALAVDSPGKVTLLMRHPIRVHQFDSDLGWITHQYLDGFHQEQDYSRRRDIIRQARHRGSIPSDVARELEVAVQNDLLVCKQDEVVGISEATSPPNPLSTLERGSRAQRGGGEVNLQLASGDHLTADHVILATGFDSGRPGGAWLDQAIADYHLPVAPDGYPIVDYSLCWSPGLYVTGPLAELEVGPVARNIIGIKLAAERIGERL